MMFDLALHYGEGAVSLRDVARRQGISEKYLWHLIPPLKNTGLITATRGAHGGYVLAKPPHLISLKEILETVEGSMSLVECTDQPSLCNRSGSCVAREIWAGELRTGCCKLWPHSPWKRCWRSRKSDRKSSLTAFERRSRPVWVMGERGNMKNRSIVNDAIIKDLVDRIHEISNGSIVISIYQSRIVQIDVTNTETRRFEDVWLVEEGAGI